MFFVFFCFSKLCIRFNGTGRTHPPTLIQVSDLMVPEYTMQPNIQVSNLIVPEYTMQPNIQVSDLIVPEHTTQPNIQVSDLMVPEHTSIRFNGTGTYKWSI